MKFRPAILLDIVGSFPAASSGIPDKTGIYIAYAGKRDINGDFWPSRLLYIGKSEDESENRGVAGRVYDHARSDHQEWLKYLRTDEEIRYAYIPIEDRWEDKIPHIEAALINAFKPAFNDEHKDAIREDLKLEETIKLQGYMWCLPDFSISPDKLIYK